MRGPAEQIEAGDVVALSGSPFSLDRGARAQVLTVATSKRSGWARDWWRLTFTDGYWVESSTRHRFEVVDFAHPTLDDDALSPDDLLGMIL
jgi:hypothetical protein